MKTVDLEGKTAGKLLEAVYAMTEFPVTVAWRSGLCVFRTQTEARWYALGVQDGRSYEQDQRGVQQ